MLPPLADDVDLTARNITVPSGMDAATILASASESVRDAAGCPILSTTSTVSLVIDDCSWIDLPGGPVTDVASVSIDGVSVSQSVLTDTNWSVGWRRLGDALLLTGVNVAALPATATITYTHGYGTVPADIVDLVCGVAAMAFRQDGDYGAAGRESSVRLGEYAESEKVPTGAESPSPVAIPDVVRNRLRARFGTSVAVVGVRR